MFTIPFPGVGDLCADTQRPRGTARAASKFLRIYALVDIPIRCTSVRWIVPTTTQRC